MEILKYEPYVVVVALSEADTRILSVGLEPEAFLEVGPSDGTHEHAMAMQAAFSAMTDALRQRARVVELTVSKRTEAGDGSDA